MREGSVFQRHTIACPKGEDGSYLPHKCRGSWSYYVDVGRDHRGRRRQLTKGGFLTRAAARAALRQLLEEVHGGASNDAHTLTVVRYLEEWLAGKRALRPSTLKSYREHLDHHLLPHLGHFKLRELQARHIDEMLNKMTTGGGRALSNGSLRRVHSTLRTALNAAVRRRLIPYNPAVAVELPTVDYKEVRVWTSEQVATFLESCQSDRLYPLFHLVVVTGMRRGEVLGLRWQDVDLDHGLLTIRQQVVQLAGQLHVGPPKTKSGYRTVPVDALTVEVLRAQQEAQRQDHAAWGDAWQATDHVFTRSNGSLMQPNLVTRRFRELSATAGLPIIRFHDLRHTSASIALAAGVAMKTVSDRLGHSTTAITADLYTHVVPVVAQEAADAIAAVIGRSRKAPLPESSSELLATGDQHRHQEGGLTWRTPRSERRAWDSNPR
jgi:integrase